MEMLKFSLKICKININAQQKILGENKASSISVTLRGRGAGPGAVCVRMVNRVIVEFQKLTLFDR